MSNKDFEPRHIYRVFNGRIVTLDSVGTIAEAALIAGNRIAAVGSGSQIAEMAPGVSTIDLQGEVLFPGFIEPHSHVMGYGLVESGAATFMNLNLAPIRTREQMYDLLRDKIRGRSAGEWITGRGFPLWAWEDAELPSRRELDRVAPHNPIFLVDMSGHITLTNSLGLKAVGYTKNTPSPANGRIYQDESGEPNGVLKDQAQLPLYDQVPLPTTAEYLEAIKTAVTNFVGMGITTVHNLRNFLPGGYQADQHVPFFELQRHGELPLHVWLMVEAYRHIGREGDYQHLDALTSLGQRSGFGGKVKIGAVKIISDGSLDSRTSCHHEEFADAPGEKGLMWRSEQDYFRMIQHAHEHGLQLAVHCNGERSTDIILDAYERALDALPMDNHRHRLEHVPLLADYQIERIGKLGLSVCTVPTFRLNPEFKEMMFRLFGAQRAREKAFRYRTLSQAGVLVFGGSDCHPCVEEWIHPLGQIHLTSEEGPIQESEKFTREEAVRMFTSEAAKASFEEKSKGTIEAGKLANLVVLSDNPVEVRGEDLKKIQVNMTIVDGDIVYRRTGSRHDLAGLHASAE